jgi:hypothetical protein
MNRCSRICLQIHPKVSLGAFMLTDLNGAPERPSQQNEDQIPIRVEPNRLPRTFPYYGKFFSIENGKNEEQDYGKVL